MQVSRFDLQLERVPKHYGLKQVKKDNTNCYETFESI